MNIQDLKLLEVGSFVTDELDRVAYTIIDKDENGFLLNNGTYHCGDSIERFEVGAGYDGYPPVAYFYTTVESNDKTLKEYNATEKQ